MRAFVVGGASFIGSYLARRLLASGHEVVSYDVNVESNVMNEILNLDEIGHIERIRGDALDLLALQRAVRQARTVDVVIHLAAALIPVCNELPAEAVRINCDGLNHSFEMALAWEIPRVVWASSIAVYGRQEQYVEEFPNEDAARLPRDIYGGCKLLNEIVAARYRRLHALETVGLRFTHVYGPGRRRGAWSYSLVDQLMARPASGLPGHVVDADTLVNWQFVDDAAQAVELAATHAGAIRSPVYNSGGDVATVREAAQLVRESLPDAEIELDAGSNGQISKLDISRIEEDLGYVPRYPLKRGIAETVAYYGRK